jgi:hypothetical protein
MSPHDSQRQKLEECIEIASKIAMCETDERTKRATVMYCLERTVDGFPVSRTVLHSPRPASLLTSILTGESDIKQSRLYRLYRCG